MIARNLAHRAIPAGHTARVVDAAQMLGDLTNTSRLRQRLRRYTSPALLVIDEIGYMSYGQGYADLLFQVVSQRYQRLSTIVTHQSHLQRMAGGLPPRDQHRRPHRPPLLQRRGPHHRRRLLPQQGDYRA